MHIYTHMYTYKDIDSYTLMHTQLHTQIYVTSIHTYPLFNKKRSSKHFWLFFQKKKHKVFIIHMNNKFYTHTLNFILCMNYVVRS